jgi:Gas vesicle protein
MSTPERVGVGRAAAAGYGPPAPRTESLADILERVLDKGIVIAGDIQINLLDIELLTIKLRLLVASVDKAREMGINWWESDPHLSLEARREQERALEDRVRQLEAAAGIESPERRENGGEPAPAPERETDARGDA